MFVSSFRFLFTVAQLVKRETARFETLVRQLDEASDASFQTVMMCFFSCCAHAHVLAIPGCSYLYQRNRQQPC